MLSGDTLKLGLFVILSAFFVWVSRASLRAPRSHGFYRFFFWELTLALVFINADRWFTRPFSSVQIVSWLLLAISVALVVHGVHLLRVVGRPDTRRSDEVPLISIEKTTSLVTVGAYRYIRHPIYGAGFYGVCGVFFKDPSWLGITLSLGAITFLVITAKVEEAECIRYFGPSYEDYMKSTKMFVPFVF